MGAIRTAANTAFRDYSTDGVPASGAHEPEKSAVRAVFGLIDDNVAGLTAVTVSATTHTISADDNGKLTELTAGTAITVNVPDDLEVGFTAAYCRAGLGQPQFVETGDAEIKSRGAAKKIEAPNDIVWLVCTAPGVYRLSGPLVA